ncbi:BZ3500_MvSof-1268-A1-R1_Chr3-1g06096 [Microbotryum saponariae]|uniref:BZ3500_MvSof-1268-A1-R1_Chr3-1g06096 protein n=1 Tax=Microbotryum saponariae TaxID=289078 RepID=A0A2X0N4E5_9BASI|nr:BZ3500_MvSof-1268-A1-R1_Chr3-1g06096 [Microbotryum saponariae]SDA03959.1 BZ3501_MvSof-1269-A2-R1_Chr3-2g05781 [Microbotryum saponariae]
MPLRYLLLFSAGEDDFHGNIPLCGSTMVSNCARYLPVLVLMTKTKRRAKTAARRMKMTRRTKRMVVVKVMQKRSRWIDPSGSQFFAYYLLA